MKLYKDWRQEPLSYGVRGVISIDAYGEKGLFISNEEPEPERIRIENAISMNRAWHDDIVHISDGSVQCILSTNCHSARIPGILFLQDKQKYGLNKKGMPIYLFRPLSSHYPFMYVASSAAKTHASAVAVYIIASYIEWTVEQKYPRGQCEEVIGVSGDAIADAVIVAHHHRLFSGNQPLCKLVHAPPAAVAAVGGRRYIDEVVFSIDPPGCIDIDDAIHAKHNRNGTIEIGVHIADVTAQFEHGSAIDAEAVHRAFTVYLPHKQVTILPEGLAHDRCSLLPGQERLCMSCIMTFDCEGASMIRCEFVETVIRSGAALSYEQVDEDNVPSAIRGALVIAQSICKAVDSHKLVEELMLLANTCAAERVPLLRRQTEQFRAAEYVFVDSSDGVSAGHRHVSLNKDAYTHFTSPIRRYADQLVHRLLKNNIAMTIGEWNQVMGHINAQQKKHRRFKRDAAILEYVHRIPGGVHSEDVDGIVAIRYSDKHTAYKVEVMIPSLAISVPLRLVTRSHEAIIKTMLDGNTLRAINLHTGVQVTFVDGGSLRVTLHCMATEPRIREKCRVTCQEIASLFN